MTEALTATARLFIDKNNIVHVTYAAGVVIDVNDVKNIYSVMMRLTTGEKPGVLVDVRNQYTITAEARSYAIEHMTPRTATAVLTQSRTTKYLNDLYSAFYPRPTPLKFFFDEDKAIEWLKQQHPRH